MARWGAGLITLKVFDSFVASVMLPPRRVIPLNTEPGARCAGHFADISDRTDEAVVGQALTDCRGECHGQRLTAARNGGALEKRWNESKYRTWIAGPAVLTCLGCASRPGLQNPGTRISTKSIGRYVLFQCIETGFESTLLTPTNPQPCSYCILAPTVRLMFHI